MKGPARQLLDALDSAQDLLILPHDHPDPDALASALGLQVVVQEWLGRRVPIALRGIVGRAENRALVEKIPIELTPAEELLPGFRGSAVLVDTQPGRNNNALPPELPVAAVIDHHPDWGSTAGVPFVDLREQYGATSTIVTQYLRELGLRPSPPLATALFYAISSETSSLVRETHPADFACAHYLYRRADKRLLGAIERPALSPLYFDLVARAVQAALVFDQVVVVLLDSVPYPDAVAEIADLMARREHVVWTVCIARRENSLHVSLRSNDPAAKAGMLLASLLPQGAAGGHGMTAGGSVPLGSEGWPGAGCALAARLLDALDASEEPPRWLVARDAGTPARTAAEQLHDARSR